MILDLCHMNTEETKQLNAIASEIRRPYLQMVEQLHKRNGKNIFWWMTPYATSFNFMSASFESICKLVFVLRTVMNLKGMIRGCDNVKFVSGEYQTA